MSAPKGHRNPGSGRVKGTPNKDTKALQDIADRIGVCFFEVLCLFAKNDEKALGYKGPQIKALKDGGVIEIPWITPDMRLKAACEGAQYLHAKRKAIEHSGSAENPIQVFLTLEERKELAKAARSNGKS